MGIRPEREAKRDYQTVQGEARSSRLLVKSRPWLQRDLCSNREIRLPKTAIRVSSSRGPRVSPGGYPERLPRWRPRTHLYAPLGRSKDEQEPGLSSGKEPIRPQAGVTSPEQAVHRFLRQPELRGVIRLLLKGGFSEGIIVAISVDDVGRLTALAFTWLVLLLSLLLC